MSVEKLKSLLEKSLRKAYEENNNLLDKKGIEQAMVFQVGRAMSDLLKEDLEYSNLDLDCEYNKCLDESKMTENFPNGIRPDLILHKRGTHDHNLLAAEFKGWWNTHDQNDIKKLKDLTGRLDNYRYQLGCFVVFGKTLEETSIRYFEDGDEVFSEDNQRGAA